MTNKRRIAEKYIRDVESGKIVANELVKLAVRRHKDDVKRSKKRTFAYYFDHKSAERALQFVCLLRHTKGVKARQPFDLQPFQAFIIYSLFGWLRKKDDKRRFQTSYTEIARKNGKTELAAAIALYCFLIDGEAGAEIYTAATKRDQASICFDAAKIMAKMLRGDSKSIKKRVGIHKYNLHTHDDFCKFEPLSSDYDTQDGLNPHCAIIDEYHAHKTDELVEVIQTGMGAREQPLLFIITTAGPNINGPCYQYRKVCVDILKGIKKDDTVFVIIFTLDEGDDWKDSKVWVKANPGLGKIVRKQFIEQQVKKAQNEGLSKEIQVKTKILNIWTSTSSTFIKDDNWVATGTNFKSNSLVGRLCYGGLDLASIRDLAALALLFPPVGDESTFKVLWRIWCPEENAKERSQSDGVNYLQWAKDGFITMTEGNVIDYSYIKRDLLALKDDFDIKIVNYDRWNSTQIVLDLTSEGAPMNPFGQGFGSMNAPTKELEKMVYAKEIDHGGNPVARWSCSNVMLKIDAAGNVKIDKAKSSEKVDPMVALVMAIGAYMNDQGDDDESYYEQNDIIIV